MKSILPQYFTERTAWRKWLEGHFVSEIEVWLAYPRKHSGKPRISYNDAVEEALCFGWIDSIVRAFDADTTMQRFSRRRTKSSFSQPNRERLRWLLKEGLVHESIREEMETINAEAFVFPPDIMDTLRADPIVWENYQQFPPGYQRIRIAYLAAARKRPAEFEKRLNNFLAKTKANQLIKGFGGIEKHY